MFPLQKVLNTPKSLLGKLPLNLFVIFHDGHEWNGNLGLLFNTKWRSLGNFSIDHFLRQSKHLTRLLLIYYFQPYYYPRFLYFKRSEFSGSSLQSPKKCFPCHAFLFVSNFLLSNHHPHSSWSFREAGLFTSSFS